MRHEGFVDRRVHPNQGAVGERHPGELGLPAADVGAGLVLAAPERAAQARGRDAVETVDAGPVADRERGHDEVADGKCRDGRSHPLDDADELVAGRLR
jgi:hypothetical protein